MSSNITSKLFGQDNILFVKSDHGSLCDLRVMVTHALIDGIVKHIPKTLGGADYVKERNCNYVISEIKIKNKFLNSPKFSIHMDINIDGFAFQLEILMREDIDVCYNAFIKRLPKYVILNVLTLSIILYHYLITD